MSVTFRIKESPHHIESYECQCVEGGKRWDRCHICDENGMAHHSVDDWPSLNVANATASAMFRCLESNFEPSGRWSKEQLPQLRHKIITVLNVRDGTLRGEEDPIDTERYHYAGIDAERLTHRFQALLALLVVAQRQGHDVLWD